MNKALQNAILHWYIPSYVQQTKNKELNGTISPEDKLFRNVLYKLYITEGYSQAELAKHFCVSKSQIQTWLREFYIPQKKLKW